MPDQNNPIETALREIRRVVDGLDKSAMTDLRKILHRLIDNQSELTEAASARVATANCRNRVKTPSREWEPSSTCGERLRPRRTARIRPVQPRQFIFSVLLCCCLSGCGTMVSTVPHRFRARVTFYHPHEDHWGSRTACGRRANEGRTVAAGRWASFGEPVRIPALRGVVGENFIVEDRGRDVERAKASRGALPVIDVYVATRAKYRYCRAHVPPVLEVLIP